MWNFLSWYLDKFLKLHIFPAEKNTSGKFFMKHFEKNNSTFYFAISLIVVAAFSRIFPHPPNVAPITALALFGGVYLEKRWSLFVPFFAMLLSDAVLGFHSTMLFVYGSFFLIALFGLWLKEHKTVSHIVAVSLCSSLLFFLVTNFGVWFMPQTLYPKTIEGLIQCYVAAIPFFRNTILGDCMYVGVLFGIFEFGKKYVPLFSPTK